MDIKKLIREAVNEVISERDSKNIQISLTESTDLENIAGVPDAEYIMVSVKAAGKDDEYGIMVMPRTLKMYFQDPIKLVNAIINERGSYKFVKYIKDHKDPNITPKPRFMQVFRAFKLETHELNPQHEPMQAPSQETTQGPPQGSNQEAGMSSHQ